MSKCVVCGNETNETKLKVKDSFYGIQYLCELACWDAYEGYYCARCDMLHDWETNKTTLTNDDYCQASDPILEEASK